VKFKIVKKSQRTRANLGKNLEESAIYQNRQVRARSVPRATVDDLYFLDFLPSAVARVRKIAPMLPKLQKPLSH
jgi:hypothetical protein